MNNENETKRIREIGKTLVKNMPKKTMRDPDRIEPFLEAFKKKWAENPDLRFGQLVVCLLGEDPFYMEDDKALEIIERGFEKAPTPNLEQLIAIILKAKGFIESYYTVDVDENLTIDGEIEEFLRTQLQDLSYEEEDDTPEFKEAVNAVRGAVSAFHIAKKISPQAYLFLSNYLHWLTDEPAFEEDEYGMYLTFFDAMRDEAELRFAVDS